MFPKQRQQEDLSINMDPTDHHLLLSAVKSTIGLFPNTMMEETTKNEEIDNCSFIDSIGNEEEDERNHLNPANDDEDEGISDALSVSQCLPFLRPLLQKDESGNTIRDLSNEDSLSVPKLRQTGRHSNGEHGFPIHIVNGEVGDNQDLAAAPVLEGFHEETATIASLAIEDNGNNNRDHDQGLNVRSLSPLLTFPPQQERMPSHVGDRQNSRNSLEGSILSLGGALPNTGPAMPTTQQNLLQQLQAAGTMGMTLSRPMLATPKASADVIHHQQLLLSQQLLAHQQRTALSNWIPSAPPVVSSDDGDIPGSPSLRYGQKRSREGSPIHPSTRKSLLMKNSSSNGSSMMNATVVGAAAALKASLKDKVEATEKSGAEASPPPSEKETGPENNQPPIKEETPSKSVSYKKQEEDKEIQEEAIDADAPVPAQGPKKRPMELQKFDIICGRDKLSQTHPGNKRFRELVENHRARYKRCMYRNDKTCITDEILAMAQSWRPGGRFLKRDAGASGKEWRDVGDHYARQKVSHALRATSKDPTPEEALLLQQHPPHGMMPHPYGQPQQMVLQREIDAFKSQQQAELGFQDLLSTQQRLLQKNFLETVNIGGSATNNLSTLQWGGDADASQSKRFRF